MVFMAISMSFAFRSCIFVSAISRIWDFLTLATAAPLPGRAEPERHAVPQRVGEPEPDTGRPHIEPHPGPDRQRDPVGQPHRFGRPDPATDLGQRQSDSVGGAVPERLCLVQPQRRLAQR